MFFIFVFKRSVWKKLQRTEPFRSFNSTRNKRKNRESVLTVDVDVNSMMTEDFDVQPMYVPTWEMSVRKTGNDV